jgi:hypothetical protein
VTCEHRRRIVWVLPRYSIADVLSGRVLVSTTSLAWWYCVKCRDCGEML